MKVSIIMAVFNYPGLTKALDSIPRRKDIEVLAVDDCSTDETWEILENYYNEHLNDFGNFIIMRSAQNYGLGHTKNTMFEMARGEYIYQLDDDDWLYPDVFEQAMNELDGSDLVYVSPEVNDGRIFRVTPESKFGYCAGYTKFIRKKFLGTNRTREDVWNEDWCLNNLLQDLPHTEKFTDLVPYHYNFPRKGSMYWNVMHPKKLSIIMPVKDRAENTKKLLDKLKNQITKEDIEIIVVENGSTEDMSFLNDYENNYTTIIFSDITGVSHARNIALEKAIGKFVCFIDNDDDIPDDYVETIYENLSDDIDWIAWQYASDDNIATNFDINEPLKSGWALWRYCFNKNLFKNIRFDETKKAGGDLIIFNIITKDTKGIFIPKVLYYFKWKNNEDSLSHKHNRGEF